MGSDGQLGLGINSAALISAKLQVRGAASTSATTSLLIQNSSLTPLLTIKDDGAATFSAQTGTTTSGTNNFVTMAASYLENKKVNTPSNHIEGSEGSRIQTLSENTVYGGFPTIKK
jgi:hypothetical protein